MSLYHSLTRRSAPALRGLLKRRLRRGKEDAARLSERMGVAARSRPSGRLAWFHASSVGEAQSTLILIQALLARAPDLHILVTTGTVTSAKIMEDRLPPQAFHQFYPLDHPRWVEAFLDHWRPDIILWMESELWPNMLRAIRTRNILCVLVNARMSPRSLRRWRRLRTVATSLLSAFDIILAQTDADAAAYHSLGALDVRMRGNLKYGADALPYDEAGLNDLRHALTGRPVWLYASTHAGEEDIACRLHQALKQKYPGLLTVIAPRHPSRGPDIAALCEKAGLAVVRRGTGHALPDSGTELYIADTMGELGLFYRAIPVVCIGRTFSSDGGGGHNPIEPAQLGCAVLHGLKVQNLAEIFAEMDEASAARPLKNEEEFFAALMDLLAQGAEFTALQSKGSQFARSKAGVVARMMADIEPLLTDAGIDRQPVSQGKAECA